MRVSLLLGLGVLGAALPAQAAFPVTVGEGLVVTGDFDADGCDDVLLIGRDTAGSAQTWFGRKDPPYLVKGPAWTFQQWWDLSDSPVFHGGYLWMPVNLRYSRVTEIQRYRLRQNRWVSAGRAALQINQPGAYLNSLKITPIPRDLDGDKQPDILAVWGESVLKPNRHFHAAYISASGKHKESKVPRIPNQPGESGVADVHVSRSFGALGGKEEYIVVLSGPYLWPTGGMGVLTIGKDLAPGRGIYGTGMPPASMGGQPANSSGCCYGRFARDRNFATVCVQLQPGPSMIVDPGFFAPYITSRGEMLDSSQQGHLLDMATHDYDGDGFDEVVLAENYRNGSGSLVYIGDPTSKRAYAQVFNLRHTARNQHIARIYHGAKGDIDGDGLQDLVLSFDGGIGGYLALFVCRREKGPGKPALRRVY